jgi:hypothetical protein
MIIRKGRSVGNYSNAEAGALDAEKYNIRELSQNETF